MQEYQSYKLPVQISGSDVYLNNDAGQGIYPTGAANAWHGFDGPPQRAEHVLGPISRGSWLPVGDRNWWSLATLQECLDQINSWHNLAIRSSELIDMTAHESRPLLTIGGVVPRIFDNCSYTDDGRAYLYYIHANGRYLSATGRWESQNNWTSVHRFETREEAEDFMSQFADQLELRPQEPTSPAQKRLAVERKLGSALLAIITSDPPRADARGHLLAKTKLWVPEEVADIVGWLVEHWDVKAVLSPTAQAGDPRAATYRVEASRSQSISGRAYFSATEQQSYAGRLSAEEIAEIIEDASDHDEAVDLLSRWLSARDFDTDETTNYEYGNEEVSNYGDTETNDDNASEILDRFFSDHPEHDPESEFFEDEDEE